MADEDPEEGKARLRRWLDIEGDDFLGTGMSCTEFMMSQQIERWRHSVSCISDRKEIRRRVRLIRAIAVAMEKLEEQKEIFNTACMDGAIVAIINGEWKEARDIAQGLDYANEPAPIRDRYAPMHAPIKALILQACDEVSDESPPPEAERH